jgi:hypothetical protein
MALQYLISTGSITLVAGTIKTAIECPASSTIPYVVYKLEVGSQANASGFMTVSWWTYGTTGTGTTVTPLKWGVDQSVAAVMGTVKVADSAEPTGTLTLLSTLFVPLPGMYSIIDPFGRETYVPISQLRCLRITSSVALPASVNMYIEQ